MSRFSFVKSVLSSRIFQVMVAVYAVYFLFSPYLEYIELEDLENIFPEPKKYLESTITGIQILIGLVIILTGFYLGKSHDYNRDYIKESANFYEIQLKNSAALEAFKTNFKLSAEAKESFKKYYDKEFPDANALRDHLLGEITKINDTNDEIEKDFSDLPKSILFMAIPTIIILSTILFYSTIIQSTITSGSFLMIIAGLVATIISFGLSWILFEKMIHVLDYGLRTIMRGSVGIKVSTERFLESTAGFEAFKNDPKWKYMNFLYRS